MNWKFTSLYPMALILVHKDYQRFRFCDAGHPFWVFYRQWKDPGLMLLEDFSAGRYPVQPKIGYNLTLPIDKSRGF